MTSWRRETDKSSRTQLDFVKKKRISDFYCTGIVTYEIENQISGLIEEEIHWQRENSYAFISREKCSYFPGEINPTEIINIRLNRSTSVVALR